MTDHFTKKQIEAFCASVLEVSEMAPIAEHIALCSDCRQIFHEIYREEREHKSFSISLEAEDWFRDEHLDYDRLVALVENKLDKEELEIVTGHIKMCALCQEDVNSFIEFRQKIESDLGTRFAPNPE